MFDAPYPYYSLGGNDPQNKGFPKYRHIYKFKARHRTYLVYLEEYAVGVTAIKFLDRRDSKANDPFTRLFNQKDSDAIKVITTCLHIMREYWVKHPAVSFAFIAAPRPVIADEVALRRGFKDFKDREDWYLRARLFVYKYAMKNLFSPEAFDHYCDHVNCIYLLLNIKDPNRESVKAELITALSEEHQNLLFAPISLG